VIRLGLDGVTGDDDEQMIGVILRTCSGAEVREMDDEVGGTFGLSSSRAHP
jgi:hypothetical protein